MSCSLLILRPTEGALETAKRAKDQGLQTIIDPLFVIEPMAWSALAASQYDALMLTSANAIKYGGHKLLEYSQLPVLAVGEATAAAARNAGFQVADTGNGGAAQLLQSPGTSQFSHILRLTGKDHVKTEAATQQITVRQVYQARALPLGDTAQAALRQRQIILLYSVRAAKILAAESDRLQLDRSLHDVAALSPNVAQAAGKGWKSVQAAESPTDDALLSLAGRLCQGK
jgi:uroporphyrinogen-III synthase